MPELPEVETIRKGLQKYLVGRVIQSIDIRMAKMVSGDVDYCIGAKIIGARRFGKGLVIDLSNGYSIAVHVKMTGQLLYYQSPVEALDKHVHIVFYFDNNSILVYRDMRQFGWVHILKTTAVPELPFFKNLGLEPLKDLTREHFSQILKNSRIAIKVLLMDQRRIAGIGNIYANDALYLAKIHPTRPASSLSEKEISLLFESIEYVLKKGIEAGGASEWNYVDVLGGKGQYQNFFLVYHKTGTICNRCGTLIKSMKLGGRGTFYCPRCQIFDNKLVTKND